MKVNSLNTYKCPVCLSTLKLKVDKEAGKKILEGNMHCAIGHIFTVSDGIPDFTWPKELAKIDKKTRDNYEKLANDYDKFASLPFRTLKSKESVIRKKITDALEIKPSSKVLEVGGGDGRGAEYIAERLDKRGILFFQELAPAFLKKSFQRLSKYKNNIEFSIGNASYLSFPDNYFDAAHHFGGINTFAEVKRCLKELARVVKPGGKVLVGDESMAPWLRNTEFGKILTNSNPLFKYNIPFQDLPIEAMDVKVEWIMMGAFFLIEFTVGNGEPKANYHIPIPSERGGTHWSRYYGNLEGITDTTKALAYKARKKSGKSMHQWLNDAVRDAAKKELNKQ